MLKRLLLSGAALAALTTFASAQTSPPADSAAPPAATAPASPGMAAPAATAEAKTDPNLFSNIKGADVVGEGDESVGAVADILIDSSGALKSLVISHGGLVGIGKTYRTYDVSELPQVTDGKLMIGQLNTAALEGLPQYEYPEAETGRASTGAAPADGSAAPAPAPAASGAELWPASNLVGASVGAEEDKASVSDIRFEGNKAAAVLIDRGSLGLGNKVEEVAFEKLTISGTPAEPQIALSTSGGAAANPGAESSTVPGGEMAPPAAPAPTAPAPTAPAAP